MRNEVIEVESEASDSDPGLVGSEREVEHRFDLAEHVANMVVATPPSSP